MKKVRLLCLLALLFAVGSAFNTRMGGVTIFPVDDGKGGYTWTTTPPTGPCLPDVPPCFIELKKEAPIPPDNTLPPAGDIESQSPETGVHPF